MAGNNEQNLRNRKSLNQNRDNPCRSCLLINLYCTLHCIHYTVYTNRNQTSGRVVQAVGVHGC